MNLDRCSEDDAVEAFKTGLRKFVQGEGGGFGARRVTLRQEKVFPSDLDIALWFESNSEVRWHLFGLQFKRWNGSGWSLSAEQSARLSRFGHVIAYCLPSPGELGLANILHAFRFVNPQRLPKDCIELALTCPAEWRPLGMAPASLASSIQRKFDFDLTLQDHLDERALIYLSDAEKISKLRTIIRTASTNVREAAQALAMQATVVPDSSWGQSLIDANGVIVPHLTWFDFFSAANQGSTIMTVPDEAAILPDSPDPPGDVCSASGIGLTLIASQRRSGAVRASLGSHIGFWTRSVLQPPAAIVAYESFSRTLEFIEYLDR
jgi:hypothetical protein